MKKGTTKTESKAAKKAPAKKPLIEGKYSHKFLVRLNPVEGAFLDEAMINDNVKTFTGMVTQMIVTYQKDKIRLMDLEQQLRQSRNELRDLQEDMSDISTAIKKAVNYKSDKPKGIKVRNWEEDEDPDQDQNHY